MFTHRSASVNLSNNVKFVVAIEYGNMCTF